jgi:hypothetical protein
MMWSTKVRTRGPTARGAPSCANHRSTPNGSNFAGSLRRVPLVWPREEEGAWATAAGRCARVAPHGPGSLRRPPTTHAGNAPFARILPLPRRQRGGPNAICHAPDAATVVRASRIARWEVGPGCVRAVQLCETGAGRSHQGPDRPDRTSRLDSCRCGWWPTRRRRRPDSMSILYRRDPQSLASCSRILAAVQI